MNREEHSEPSVTQAVPLLAASNMAASIHFYVNGLGFDMKNQWLDEGRLRWCRLQLDRAALMLDRQDEDTDGKHDALCHSVRIFFLFKLETSFKKILSEWQFS